MPHCICRLQTGTCLDDAGRVPWHRLHKFNYESGGTKHEGVTYDECEAACQADFMCGAYQMGVTYITESEFTCMLFGTQGRLPGVPDAAKYFPTIPATGDMFDLRAGSVTKVKRSLYWKCNIKTGYNNCLLSSDTECNYQQRFQPVGLDVSTSTGVCVDNSNNELPSYRLSGSMAVAKSLEYCRNQCRSIPSNACEAFAVTTSTVAIGCRLYGFALQFLVPTALKTVGFVYAPGDTAATDVRKGDSSKVTGSWRCYVWMPARPLYWDPHSGLGSTRNINAGAMLGGMHLHRWSSGLITAHAHGRCATSTIDETLKQTIVVKKGSTYRLKFTLFSYLEPGAKATNRVRVRVLDNSIGAVVKEMNYDLTTSVSIGVVRSAVSTSQAASSGFTTSWTFVARDDREEAYVRFDVPTGSCVDVGAVSVVLVKTCEGLHDAGTCIDIDAKTCKETTKVNLCPGASNIRCCASGTLATTTPAPEVTTTAAAEVTTLSTMPEGGASYEKLDQAGTCRNANNQPFTRVHKSGLGDGYVTICKALCATIGPRCVGFYVSPLSKACFALGERITKNDGVDASWDFFKWEGTGNIHQTSNQGTSVCYRKITANAVEVKVTCGAIGEGSTAIVASPTDSKRGPAYLEEFVVPVHVNTGCRSLNQFRLLVQYIGVLVIDTKNTFSSFSSNASFEIDFDRQHTKENYEYAVLANGTIYGSSVAPAPGTGTCTTSVHIFDITFKATRRNLAPITFTTEVQQLTGGPAKTTHERMDQDGKCLDAAGERFTAVYMGSLGLNYIAICRTKCTSMGLRCVGFSVQQDTTACWAHSEGRAEGDGKGGWALEMGVGTGIITQTDAVSCCRCYRKTAINAGISQSITPESASGAACVSAPGAIPTPTQLTGSTASARLGATTVPSGNLVAYQKLGMDGTCLDGSGRVFTELGKSSLEADVVAICEAKCTSLGTRCVGFYVPWSSTGCYTLGEGLTEGDAKDGWLLTKRPGTGLIMQTTGGISYSCYNKTAFTADATVTPASSTHTRTVRSAAMTHSTNASARATSASTGTGTGGAVTITPGHTTGPASLVPACACQSMVPGADSRGYGGGALLCQTTNDRVCSKPYGSTNTNTNTNSAPELQGCASIATVCKAVGTEEGKQVAVTPAGAVAKATPSLGTDATPAATTSSHTDSNNETTTDSSPSMAFLIGIVGGSACLVLSVIFCICRAGTRTRRKSLTSRSSHASQVSNPAFVDPRIPDTLHHTELVLASGRSESASSTGNPKRREKGATLYELTQRHTDYNGYAVPVEGSSTVELGGYAVPMQGNGDYDQNYAVAREPESNYHNYATAPLTTQGGTPHYGEPLTTATNGTPHYGAPLTTVTNGTPHYGEPLTTATKGVGPEYGAPLTTATRDDTPPHYAVPLTAARDGTMPHYCREGEHYGAPLTTARDGTMPHYGAPLTTAGSGTLPARYGAPLTAADNGTLPHYSTALTTATDVYEENSQPDSYVVIAGRQQPRRKKGSAYVGFDDATTDA